MFEVAKVIPFEPIYPKPETLGPDLLPVPALDLELLPDAFRPWIADMAERLQCPPEFLAVPAMVAAGAAIGRRCGIKPKRLDDWTITPNMWGAIVGRPSTMKSPAIDGALAPLRRLEAKAAKANEAADIAFERASKAHQAAEKAANEAAKAAAKRAQKDGVEPPDLAAFFRSEAPKQPAHLRFITNDATYEKAGALMAENPMGILVERDELVGFLRPLDRDEHAAARGFWLTAWNGQGQHTFDRIGRGTVRLEAVCASLIGGVQPSRLAAYVKDAVTGGAGDDGLLQRFSLIVWPDADPDWRDVDRYPDTIAKARAFEVFERLTTIDAESLGANKGRFDEIPALRLSDEAAEAFLEWRTNLERRTRGGGLHPAFESHIVKYRKLVPALALINHLVDAPNGGPVTLDAVLRAIAWAEYLEPHAARAYGAATMPERTGARTIWTRCASLGAHFTARDVQRRGWVGLAESDAVQRALEVLETHHLLLAESVLPGEFGGRPSKRYSVNPLAIDA